MEVFRLRFLAQDGDAGLKVWIFQVAEQAALKAGHQPLFQVRDILGRAVGGEHDLLSGVKQGVEGVEKLFLRAFLAGEEMDVIHQQQVNFAVFGTEFRHLVGADGFDHLVGKLFAGGVIDGAVAPLFRHEVAHRLHQMRLSHPAFAVDEERIVGIAGRFSNRFGGGVGKVVVAADHKLVEGKAFVQPRVQHHPVAAVFRLFSPGAFHPVGRGDELHRIALVVKRVGNLAQSLCVILIEIVGRKLGGHPYDQRTVRHIHQLGFRKPGAETLLIDVLL